MWFSGRDGRGERDGGSRREEGRKRQGGRDGNHRVGSYDMEQWVHTREPELSRVNS